MTDPLLNRYNFTHQEKKMLSSHTWTPEAWRYPGLPTDKQVLTAITSLMRQLAQNFSSSNLHRSEHGIGARYVIALIFLTSLLPYFLLFISDDWILGFVLYLITTYYSKTLQVQTLLNAEFLEIHTLPPQQGWFIIIIRLGTVPFGKLLPSNICITDSKPRANKLSWKHSLLRLNRWVQMILYSHAILKYFELCDIHLNICAPN